MIIELYDRLNIEKNSIYDKLYKKDDLIILEKKKLSRISLIDKERKEFKKIKSELDSLNEYLNYEVLKSQIEISLIKRA